MAYTCPKCRGEMHSYERQGVHIEQCANCRGVFLDYGELEHLTQFEARMMTPPPPAAPPPAAYPPPAYGHGAPAWGAPYGRRRGGFSHMLFST